MEELPAGRALEGLDGTARAGHGLLWSRVSKYTGPPPITEAGGLTDASDPVLASLRDDIANPVVSSLLRDEELEQLLLAWGKAPREQDVWLGLVACGEEFRCLLRSTFLEQTLDAAPIMTRLADELQDWICQSSFGWGQLRMSPFTSSSS
jgi:hypothetical protein